MVTQIVRLCGVLIVGISCCGCGAESKERFADRLRAACTRSESRVSPKTMELDELQAICGRTPEVSELDEQTRRWLFVFPDGAVEVPVLTDAGSEWSHDNPRVFVLVTQIKVR
jgi:hypothetical protein